MNTTNRIGMTNKDFDLLDEAMETTYKSTIRRLIEQADTEECKERLRDIMRLCPE